MYLLRIKERCDFCNAVIESKKSKRCTICINCDKPFPSLDKVMLRLCIHCDWFTVSHITDRDRRCLHCGIESKYIGVRPSRG